MPDKAILPTNSSTPDKANKKTKNKKNKTLLAKPVRFPLWLTLSAAAQLCGVNNKTIRRAVLNADIKYKIAGNRYFVEFSDVIRYMHTTRKLKNKLKEKGIGQYIEGWRE